MDRLLGGDRKSDSMQEFAQRFGRTDLEVNVDLEGDDDTSSGTTKNIGTGGMFVATDKLRPVGARVALRLAIPGAAEAISVEGEVRWIREQPSAANPDRSAGMGLRFVNVPFEAAAAIQSFLNERERARTRPRS
jgi:uncharacterized protein (TIGR02266 family)